MGKLTKAFEKARERGRETDRPLTDTGRDLEQASSPKEIAAPFVEADAPRNQTRQEEKEARAAQQVRPRSQSRIDKPIDDKIIVYYRPESLAAEHFKLLRATIFHPRDGRKIKSLLITSAMEQEGKTFTACNLAVSIAQSINPYVLLIDADTRKPKIHGMLGMRNDKGLTDYLREDDDLANYLVKAPIPKMTILPSGKPVKNPAELMTSEKMHALIEETRQRYADRFVILDAPPVMLAAETVTLSQQVDAVILVVRYGHSIKEAVEEAVERIGRERIHGIVFNAFEVPPRKQSYFKQYGYGYSYGYAGIK